MIYPNAAATVGNTPLVEFSRLGRELRARIVGKLEMRNPAGSVKDRLGVALIEDAERRGVLKPGMTIVEPTGGNTPGILMAEAVARAKEITQRTPGAINLDQFSNPANPALHKRTTGVEIWNDTNGAVDVFVSAVGTGGTITGVGEFLKDRKPGVKVIAVEPTGAAVLSGRPVGTHQMPGIGVGFVPRVLNREVLDEVIAVSDADAFASARRLARAEGVLAGVSAGAALHASLQIAAQPEYAGKMIVVIICDSGARDVSSAPFAETLPPTSESATK